MYQQLYTRLGLGGSYLTAYSEAVPMSGGNATQFDFVIFSVTGSGVFTVTIQESNDLENWTDRTGTGSSAASSAGTIGYTLSAVATGVAAGHVRAKVVLSGSTPTGVMSLGLNTTML